MKKLASRILGWLPLDTRARKHLKFAYFKSMALLGIAQFPALNNLDRRLLPHVKPRGGFFIEAGANDGISQSNTWFLEAYRGWNGLLIEPLPGLADMAARFRKARVLNVALGPAGSDGKSLELFENDLETTAVNGASWQAGRSPVRVPMRALSSLLDEAGVREIDLFSLDVERYEVEVLQGLDLARHRPKFILIETARLEEVQRLLAPYYDLRENFTNWDYLFEAR